MLPVGGLRPNTGQMEAIGVHANPRQISESDYAKLLKSMRDKNMTGLLPLKVYQYNGEWIVLGGNMRLRAMQELGIESVSCIVVPEGTDAETLNEFIIKDNSTYGNWDMDALANWDEPLDDWGVDVPKFEEHEKPEEEAHEEKVNTSEVVIASVSLFGQTGETIACVQLKPEDAERLLQVVKEQGADAIIKRLVA